MSLSLVSYLLTSRRGSNCILTPTLTASYKEGPSLNRVTGNAHLGLLIRAATSFFEQKVRQSSVPPLTMRNATCKT